MAAEQGELEQQLVQDEAQPGTAGNDEVADAQAVADCPSEWRQSLHPLHAQVPA